MKGFAKKSVSSKQARERCFIEIIIKITSFNRATKKNTHPQDIRKHKRS